MDTLLLPCWRRPEFLHHCLDNLVKTGDLDTVLILFKPDAGYFPDIDKVIDQWDPLIPHWGVLGSTPSLSDHTKQSLNVLSGYKAAAEKSTGLVFMVEEDIMVGRDFFRFHRALHEQEPKLFCSLSVMNHNRHANTTNDPDAYYLSHGDYCSWGVVFQKEIVEKHIVPHLNEGYLRNAPMYCKTQFPGSKIGLHFTEQDGLIRRAQEATTLKTAYPHVPRAFHAGWYGYNRARSIGGTLEKKIEHVARTIYDPVAMRKACLNEDYYRDSQPIPLELPPWKALRNVPA